MKKHTNFTEAHTVVDVPLHIMLVPTYMRNQVPNPKVQIGSAYRPRIDIAPSVEIYRPRTSMLPAAVFIFSVISLFVMIGSFFHRS